MNRLCLSNVAFLGVVSGGETTVTQAMNMVLAPSVSEGSIGDVVTLAMLTPSSRGTLPGTWGLVGATSPTTTLTLTKLAVAAATPMTVPMKVGATAYDGTGNLSMKFDCNNPLPAGAGDTWEGFVLSFAAATATDLLCVAYVKLANLPADGFEVSINNDLVSLTGANGYAVSQQIQYIGEPPNFIHGHSEGELGNDIAISDREKIYELVIFYDADSGLGQYLLLDENTVIGASDSIMSGPSGDFVSATIQNYLTNRLGDITFYLVGFNWTNPTYPNRAFAVPSVTEMGLVQTGVDDLSLTFTSVVTRFNIDKSENGGGSWTRIETNLRLKTVLTEKTYVDSTVVDGRTYRYRVTALISERPSTPVSGSDVTVDNAPFSGGWQDTIAIVSTNTDGDSNEFALLAKLVVGTGGTCSKARVYNGAVRETLHGLKIGVYNSSLALIGQGEASNGSGPDSWTEVVLDVPITGIVNGQTLWVGFLSETASDYNFRYLNGGASNAQYFQTVSYASWGPSNPFVADGTLTRTYAAGLYVFTP